MSKKKSLKAAPILQRGDPADAKSVDELLIATKAPSHTKYLYVTDGSGSSRTRPAGWGGVLVRLHDRELISVGGSAYSGTSQEAELRAIAEGLNHLVATGAGDQPGGCHVLIITDSSYAARQITEIAENALAAMNFNQHAMVLAGIQAAMRVGVTFQSVHIGRNTNPLMVFADKSSKIFRKSVPKNQISSLLTKQILDANEEFAIDRE